MVSMAEMFEKPKSDIRGLQFKTCNHLNQIKKKISTYKKYAIIFLLPKFVMFFYYNFILTTAQ